MDNTILKSLSVENFASFAEKITFTTQADLSKKEHLENTFTLGPSYFNKVSFLYGANGSGKTFFCKILREIQRLLDWSPITAMNSTQFLALPQFKGLDAAVRPFAFDRNYANKPTNFAIEVVIEDVTYSYSFSIQGKTILSELLTKKKQRTQELLRRTSSSFKDIQLFSELRDFENTKHVVKEEALSLPIAALLNNQLAQKIVDAIQSIQVVSMTGARLKPTGSRSSFSQERVAKYVQILKKADPTLRKMEISYSEEEVERKSPTVDDNDFENRKIITTTTTVGIESIHAVFENGQETVSEPNVPITFFADESLGTIKLFTALPYLYDVLENGGILVVDEIENGLHLSLVKEIIGLFCSEDTNPLHAQLICTSHQPLLLDGDFRRDQVWVTRKDEYGRCSMHRMSE